MAILRTKALYLSGRERRVWPVVHVLILDAPVFCFIHQNHLGLRPPALHTSLPPGGLSTRASRKDHFHKRLRIQKEGDDRR